jgi:hypothetical protein
MSEGMNIGVAHELIETTPSDGSRKWVIEIVEAVALSVIAVATAWCGYHAARWDGRQALLYGTSARMRVEAAVDATQGGQQRLLDVVTLNTWIHLRETHSDNLAGVYVRRFSPEYRVAFEAWLKTDPFNNLNAPSGPADMPEYRNTKLLEADQLNRQATEAFDQGTKARENSEQFVRGTVLLATILFLIAVAQRFRIHIVRVGLLLVATAMIIYVLANVAHYPKL